MAVAVAAAAAVAVGVTLGLLLRQSGHTPRNAPSTVAEARALRAAASRSGIFVPFPTRLGTSRCRIPRGGPAVVELRGTCETRIKRRGGAFLVTFRERWSASDFREAHSPRHGTLTHTWRFVVSPRGRVLHFAASGDFPPQLVR